MRGRLESKNFNLSQGSGSFFYVASNLWNHLPPEIRLAQSREIFRSSVKSWIKSRIPVKAQSSTFVVHIPVYDSLELIGYM